MTGTLVADGALRINRVLDLPVSISGGQRRGDEDFDAVTGRRPMIEASLARIVDAEPGIEVHRGVAVHRLTVDRRSWLVAPHVNGVVTSKGDLLRSDLVIDASGRHSQLSCLLAAAGARRPAEEREEAGFVYYGRHFRSADGSVPPPFGPPLQAYDSISIVALPADHGTWGLGIVASGRDRALRAARDPDVWTRVVKSYPLVAHWLEGQPMTAIDVMAGIEDSHRDLWVGGRPVATGVVAVADAWAATNPSLGRGATIGLIHAVAVRDALRTSTAPRRSMCRRYCGRRPSSPSSRSIATRWRSTATAWPRSTPSSIAGPTRRTTPAGSSARRCARTPRRTRICCGRRCASPACWDGLRTCWPILPCGPR